MTTIKLGADIEGDREFINLSYEERKRHIECINFAGEGVPLVSVSPDWLCVRCVKWLGLLLERL